MKKIKDLEIKVNKNAKKKFIEAGVYEHKMIEVQQPSVAWSKTRKMIVDYTNYLEIVTNPDGSQELSIRNNEFKYMKTYNKLTPELVNKINNSEGIFVYYDDENYRFDFMENILVKYDFDIHKFEFIENN
jgi:phage pi2 protein 07